MSTNLEGLKPGDVLAVSSRSWFMRLLSLFLRSRWNHVAVVHHADEAGTLWAIEAAPKGVAWRPVREIADFIDNRDQPKTQAQRIEICAILLGMMKMTYDWDAIQQEAFHLLDERVDVTWDMDWDGARPPLHVICSSLAAYAQWKVKLAGPHSWLSTPPDWGRFIQERGWESFVGNTRDEEMR